MGEKELRWYDEPRWYYVGDGKLRYKDSNGWTDQYQDIDSQPTAAVEPAVSSVAVGPAAGPGSERAPDPPSLIRLCWSAAHRMTAGLRQGWSTSGSYIQGAFARKGKLLAHRDGAAPTLPEPMSPDWVVSLGIGAQNSLLSRAKFTTHGTLTLAASRVGTDDWRCAGIDGHDDLTAGAPVKITDASGNTLALGQLDPCEYFEDEDDSSIGTCVFTFTVANTPGGEDFYTVKVGGHSVSKFTNADMRAGPLLNIGDPRPRALTVS